MYAISGGPHILCDDPKNDPRVDNAGTVWSVRRRHMALEFLLETQIGRRRPQDQDLQKEASAMSTGATGAGATSASGIGDVDRCHGCRCHTGATS